MKQQILFVVLAFAASQACTRMQPASVDVIPQPQEAFLSGQTVRAGRLRTAVRKSMAPEEYVLRVSAGGRMKIVGGSETAVFYGQQTLGQITDSDSNVPVCRIHDWPRYEWRGFMLDEARHFSGEARVKFLLDEMSRIKMNRFHWHLTDAQGWRIEIKAYPRLAEVGGEGTHSDIHAPAQYYTQDQIRDIVAYAAERGIEVIPEIDMPGHTSAACKAYPEYSGGGVSAGFPDFTFNVGKEETYAFLENILKEIAQLFPTKYIMIGGDEVSYGSYAWLANPDIKALMEREGYDNVLQAEGYFIRRIAGIVKGLGKEIIGWDDIVDFDVPVEGTMMMWWRHDNVKRLHNVLDKGYTTVLCPRKPMYFDFVQHDDHKVGRKWDGFCPIEDVYAFPDAYYEHWGVKEEDLANVIGIQSNLWSELTHDVERVDFMIFPRIFATAESAWTLPDQKDYERFSTVLEREYHRMEAMNLYYYDYRNPHYHPEPAGPIILDRPVQKLDFKD